MVKTDMAYSLASAVGACKTLRGRLVSSTDPSAWLELLNTTGAVIGDNYWTGEWV